MMYIIFNSLGEEIDRAETAEAAADIMLTYDGHEYDIKLCPAGCELWVSANSRNSSLGATKKHRWAGYTADTYEGVYLNVIKNGGVCDTSAMTLSEYIAYRREISEEV